MTKRTQVPSPLHPLSDAKLAFGVKPGTPAHSTKTTRSPKRHWPRGVTILHEDRDLLVVEKPPGLLAVGTDRIREETLYYKLTDYVRKGNAKSRERVFIVHRLDKEASGILVFARSEAAKEHLQTQWDKVEKGYLAIIHGRMSPNEGTISSYLAENTAHRVYTTQDAKEGKLSHTRYRVLAERGRFSCLGVDLLTGRKHQIRVHLAHAGHPIVGDQKYGKPDKVHRRLALHAKSLSFDHPYSGERMRFETKTPRYFSELIGPTGEPTGRK